MISRARSSNFCLGRGPCAYLTLTFSGSILVLHCPSEPSGWPSAGCIEVNKCTVFWRNIKRNIKRYWISRRICRSISCSVLRRPALGLTHLGGEGETLQPGGPRVDLGGHVTAAQGGGGRARGAWRAQA